LMPACRTRLRATEVAVRRASSATLVTAAATGAPLSAALRSARAAVPAAPLSPS
jgi:hypothetical protein